jgi:hypothetical protein
MTGDEYRHPSLPRHPSFVPSTLLIVEPSSSLNFNISSRLDRDFVSAIHGRRAAAERAEPAGAVLKGGTQRPHVIDLGTNGSLS